MKFKTILLGLSLGLALTVIGCGEDKTSNEKTAAPAAAQIEILGAGATFPYPLYSEMFTAYVKETGVKVNYQAIGSGGGQRQIKNKTVDFGGSDAFVSDKKLAKFEAPLVHIPMALGAVSITYNIDGSPQLKLSPALIKDIFLGNIKKWNHERIVKNNPGVSLPDQQITVVRRSDGSGTTAIFTDYLAKVSPEWAKKVGKGKSVKWPVGLGAKGNDGVTNVVKKTTGAIAYVELAYAIKNNLPVAAVKNVAGNFVKPDIQGTSLAGEGEIPADTRVSLTNTAAEFGYPIAGFTWILLYQEQKYSKRTKEQSKALIELIWWMSHAGQKYAEPLHYAPIPAKAKLAGEAILKSITFGGQPLVSK